jgi:PadR family transcriptional regulator, regulatory protein PadR
MWYPMGVAKTVQSKTDVLQGTLDLMVLQTIESLGPLHGYAISARIQQVSGGALQLNMGTLYPAVMRLEQRGLIRGNWGATDTKRKARFYELTRAGRSQLAKEKQAWDRMAGIINALLHTEA